MISLLALILGSALSWSATFCGLEGEKKTVARDGSGHTVLWSLPFSPSLLRKAAPGSSRYSAYLGWVRRHNGADARDNLLRQMRLLEKVLKELDPGDGFASDLRNDIAGLKVVLAGRAGRIRPMSCLESLAFQEMLETIDLTRYPKEMLVVVLRKGEQVKVMGDFYARDDGSAAFSPSTWRELQRLRGKGWRLLFHIHNHPYNFANEYGDHGGQTYPSAVDLQLYLKLRPELAIVTDGIESIELVGADVVKLKNAR